MTYKQRKLNETPYKSITPKHTNRSRSLLSEKSPNSSHASRRIFDSGQDSNNAANVNDYDEEDLDDEGLANFTQEYTQGEIEPDSIFDHQVDLSQTYEVEYSQNSSSNDNADHIQDHCHISKRTKYNDGNHTPMHHSIMKDSEKMVFRDEFGTRKLYKTLEIFKPKSQMKKNYIYVIQKFIYKNTMTKKSICEVFRKRSDTFIDKIRYIQNERKRIKRDDEIEHLRDEYKWINVNKAKLKVFEWVKLMHPCEIPLSNLGEKIETISLPDTGLWYEESVKSSKSHGFSLVYKLQKSTPVRTSSVLELYAPAKVLELFAGAGGMS